MDNYCDKMKELIENIEHFKQTDIVVVESVEDRVYTYHDIYEKANKIGSYLKNEHISEILICAENSLELFLVYFAAMFYNITVIPIDPEKSSDEIKLIREIHSSAIFFTREEIKTILMDSQTSILEIKGITDVDLKRTYLITYTSGSTGQPKGVKHSVENLFLAALEFGIAMQYDSNIIMCHVMPMTYMAGVLNTIFLPYIMGGKIVLMERFSMKSAFCFWKMVERYQVNTFWLSPTMLRILDILDAKGSMQEYLHKVDAKVSVGTAPLDNILRLKIEQKYNIKIYQSYGLSETLFVSTEMPGVSRSNNSSGKLLSGVQTDFTSDNELLISVPWMFQGYVNSDINENKFYNSGDIAKIINEELFINGRKKELIIKGGFNINPRNIENILVEKGMAEECSVLSIPIKGEENIICCYTGEKVYDIYSVNTIIQNTLGKKYCIDFLEKMKSIPKNLNGKIDKKKLKYEMEKKYGN